MIKGVKRIIILLNIFLCLTTITTCSIDYRFVQSKQEVEVALLEEKEEVKEQEEIPQVSKTIYKEESSNNIIIPNVLSKDLLKDPDGNNFYLNHDKYGNYDENGTPYIDVRTDFSTRKTIIYAHSFISGNGPFQNLQNYHNNKGYYDAHKYIIVNYEGSTYRYEIFSVYVSTANSATDEGLEYFRRMNYSDEAWNERINQYKANSEYETGVEVSGNDRILILQTCSMDPNYYGRYYRYNLLIMAKLV